MLKQLALATAFATAPFAAFADWELDKSHTAIMFEVSHLGFSNTVGFFEEYDADITFDAGNLTATEVSFTIQADSINTLFAARDNHVRGADFLDVANFPEITFVSTGVEQTSDTTAMLMGDLTIKGVTQPVSFDVVVNNIGPNPFNPNAAIAGFTITGEIDRTDFGVNFAAPAVGAVMPITINTELSNPNGLGS
ncbi:MAG: YceI family protein [Pseudomonadota bacterium]